MLSVETAINGDSKIANEKGLPWLVRWACPAFVALVGAVQMIFSPTVHLNSFVPIAQQAGQAVVLGRLPLSLCLWSCKY